MSGTSYTNALRLKSLSKMLERGSAHRECPRKYTAPQSAIAEIGEKLSSTSIEPAGKNPGAIRYAKTRINKTNEADMF